MKAALISATKNSIQPIEQAFEKYAPEIEYVHLLDSDLLNMMERDGLLTKEMIDRFIDLCRLAVKSKVDVIQLTCSAFNDAVDVLRPVFQVPIFRSDQAMLDKALKYKKVGLISTVKETPIALSNYLKRQSPDIEILSKVDDGAIHLLSKGKLAEHDSRVLTMINEINDQVDVIVLSQYSMEHIASQINLELPILTAAKETVLHLKSLL
ncbi:aspartate/glutamate racemase family protein [Siminovitchia fortis]|uniref:aspartate/glutamate racemase family protein n=1 Tax=Siminovitchia fortis TaxID=254758 RepID=UPI00119F2CE9|nr:aspartate/glutamate racemase family protein [Siminovitchia fortis]